MSFLLWLMLTLLLCMQSLPMCRSLPPRTRGLPSLADRAPASLPAASDRELLPSLLLLLRSPAPRLFFRSSNPSHRHKRDLSPPARFCLLNLNLLDGGEASRLGCVADQWHALGPPCVVAPVEDPDSHCQGLATWRWSSSPPSCGRYSKYVSVIRGRGAAHVTVICPSQSTFQGPWRLGGPSSQRVMAAAITSLMFNYANDINYMS
jgi:hypothetical protein